MNPKGHAALKRKQRSPHISPSSSESEEDLILGQMEGRPLSKKKKAKAPRIEQLSDPLSDSDRAPGQLTKPLNPAQDPSLGQDKVPDVGCIVCGGLGDETQTLLCDYCDSESHMQCLTPVLAHVPAGDFRCFRCLALKNQSVPVPGEYEIVPHVLDKVPVATSTLEEVPDAMHNIQETLGSSPSRTTKKSSYRGVVYRSRSQMWLARYSTKGRKEKIMIGLFPTELEAAYAYDEYVLRELNSWSKVNFQSSRDKRESQRRHSATSQIPLLVKKNGPHPPPHSNEEDNFGRKKYRGVAVHKIRPQASIYCHGKSIYLGTFNSVREAAMAYDKAVVSNQAPLEYLNFPERYDAQTNEYLPFSSSDFILDEQEQAEVHARYYQHSGKSKYKAKTNNNDVPADVVDPKIEHLNVKLAQVETSISSLKEWTLTFEQCQRIHEKLQDLDFVKDHHPLETKLDAHSVVLQELERTLQRIKPQLASLTDENATSGEYLEWELPQPLVPPPMDQIEPLNQYVSQCQDLIDFANCKVDDVSSFSSILDRLNHTLVEKPSVKTEKTASMDKPRRTKDKHDEWIYLKMPVGDPPMETTTVAIACILPEREKFGMYNICHLRDGKWSTCSMKDIQQYQCTEEQAMETLAKDQDSIASTLLTYHEHECRLQENYHKTNAKLRQASRDLTASQVISRHLQLNQPKIQSSLSQIRTVLSRQQERLTSDLAWMTQVDQVLTPRIFLELSRPTVALMQRCLNQMEARREHFEQEVSYCQLTLSRVSSAEGAFVPVQEFFREQLMRLRSHYSLVLESIALVERSMANFVSDSELHLVSELTEHLESVKGAWKRIHWPESIEHHSTMSKKDWTTTVACEISKNRKPEIQTLVFYHKGCLGHQTPPGHPECPERLSCALDILSEIDLDRIVVHDLSRELVSHLAPPRSTLTLVHAPSYLEALAQRAALAAASSPEFRLVFESHAERGASTVVLKEIQTEETEELQEELHVSAREFLHEVLTGIQTPLDPRLRQSVSQSSGKGKKRGAPPPTAFTALTAEVNGPTDTYVSAASWDVALLAAGTVCRSVDAVLKSSTQSSSSVNAMCLVRPPGHHVGRFGRTPGAPSSGFCLLNNVQIGAMYARQHYGAMIQRVAIFDWDIHHGNGTEDLVRDDPKTYFASVHLFTPHFFPGTGPPTEDNPKDPVVEVSIDKPDHHVLNVGLDATKGLGRGSLAFRHSLSYDIFPAIEKFNPDLIFISAGFDGHRDDIIGGGDTTCGEASLTTTPLGIRNHDNTAQNPLELAGDPDHLRGYVEEDYVWATQELVRIAQTCCAGRLISVLEGGYDVRKETNSLAKSIKAHIEALASDATLVPSIE